MLSQNAVNFHTAGRVTVEYFLTIAVTIDLVTVKIANWLLIRQPNYSHSAIHPVEQKRELTYSFFLSVMPTKDLTPFSYISPQKTPFSTINYELTTEFLSVKSQKMGKNGPTHKSRYRASRKFNLLLQCNLFITFNEMRIKYYRYCVG